MRGRVQPSQLAVSCPYCGQYPFERSRGLEGHIQQKAACSKAREQRQLEQHLRLQHSTQSSSSSCTVGPATSLPSEAHLLHENVMFGCSNDDFEASAETTNSDSDSDIIYDQTDNEDDSSTHNTEPLNPSGPWLYLERSADLEPQIGSYVGTKWENMKANEK